MSNIDYSRLILSQEQARTAADARQDDVKAACRAQIEAVLDTQTMQNLLGAAALDSLSAKDRASFGLAMKWIDDMRAACRAAIDAGGAAQDVAWPAPHARIGDLAARF